MSESVAPPPEFSFTINLDGAAKNGKKYSLSANEAERAQIAKRLGVLAVVSFKGEASVRASSAKIEVDGMLEAELTRECTVSLEAMQEHLCENFSITFLRGSDSVRNHQDDADEEAPDLDSPEIHEGETFDLGELLVQQLSLAMNPFPRKEGAVNLAEQFGTDKEASPFAALQELANKND